MSDNFVPPYCGSATKYPSPEVATDISKLPDPNGAVAGPLT